MARTASRRDDARYRAAEQAVWSSRGLVPEEHRVDVPELGLGIRALVHGEGRPVVFVHGTPSAANVFVPLVERLEGVRAILIDRPGCGLSDPIDYTTMTPGRLREVIGAYMCAVIDELAGGAADLIGSSAGGMVVLTFAAMRPELVRSVVLEGMPAVEWMRLPVPMRMATFPPVAAAVVRHSMKERDVQQSFKEMGHGDLVRSGAMPRADVDWRMAVGNFSDTFLHELALLQRAASWRGPRRGWAAGASTLAQVQAPTLWLVGDRDPFAPARGVAELAALMPHATVQERPGEGHLPWVDAPREHARIIGDWWADLGARPS
ncbi:alpha/beta fold hydrolase [Demequina capsici]|uniref:Alpha/beta hydrolase n=1 Tax=Demequina capsici TaxID=3075620 RepID=A0AA96F578_9MICO|nr:alpha/beta hydrolase [Demequina sp. OYTSA14]WNM23644.1 alpha/beta hydrolase [Demequina sp. OYTSA14]